MSKEIDTEKAKEYSLDLIHTLKEKIDADEFKNLKALLKKTILLSKPYVQQKSYTKQIIELNPQINDDYMQIKNARIIVNNGSYGYTISVHAPMMSDANKLFFLLFLNEIHSRKLLIKPLTEYFSIYQATVTIFAGSHGYRIIFNQYQLKDVGEYLRKIFILIQNKSDPQFNLNISVKPNHFNSSNTDSRPANLKYSVMATFSEVDIPDDDGKINPTACLSRADTYMKLEKEIEDYNSKVTKMCADDSKIQLEKFTISPGVPSTTNSENNKYIEEIIKKTKKDLHIKKKQILRDMETSDDDLSEEEDLVLPKKLKKPATKVSSSKKSKKKEVIESESESEEEEEIASESEEASESEDENPKTKKKPEKKPEKSSKQSSKPEKSTKPEKPKTDKKKSKK